MTAPEEHDRPITENTPTRIKEALIVGCAMLSGALWINSRLTGVEHATERVNDRLTSMEVRLGRAWTRDDMRVWASEVQAANPGFHAPKVQ